MLKIDDYAYSSKLAKEVPKNKMFFGIIPLTICLFANSFLVSTLTILLMAVMSIRFTQISCMSYLKLMLVPFGFLFIGTATIIVTKHPLGQDLLIGFTLGDSHYGIDNTSLFYGINLILRALSAVSCMYFISLNTPMHDMLFALQKLRVPKLLLSLMELIYSYIFVLLDEARKMKIAQSSRLGYCNFKSSVNSTGELIAMLFIRTYLRCDTIYSALESRCYTGELKMLQKEYETHKFFCVLTPFTCVILIIAALLERGYLI